MSSLTTIKLDHPVKVAGVEVAELRFRRASVRDIKIARAGGKADDFDLAVTLAANLAEITPDDVLNLDVADFKKVEVLIAGFLGSSKD
jgi:hypothetical protein